jgi:hypothetical protein
MTKADGGQQRNNQPTTGAAKEGGGEGGDGNSVGSGNDSDNGGSDGGEDNGGDSDGNDDDDDNDDNGDDNNDDNDDDEDDDKVAGSADQRQSRGGTAVAAVGGVAPPISAHRSAATGPSSALCQNSPSRQWRRRSRKLRHRHRNPRRRRVGGHGGRHC